MAGILDTKQRIMDTIVTLEGRRQVAAGDLQIRYVSFTDLHTFYEGSGSLAEQAIAPAASRLYFEAMNRPQDQIIFETDDAGRMMPFKGGNIEIFGDGRLRYGSTGSAVDSAGNVVTGSYLTLATGSEVMKLSANLLTTSSTNFSDQYIIGTKELFSETGDFVIAPDEMTFSLSDQFPFKGGDITVANINNIESLWQDMRLAHLPHYSYLPPKNSPLPGMLTGSNLGNYPKFDQTPPLTFQDLDTHLKTRENRVMRFTTTSPDNNVVAQLLAVTPKGVEKLALIDFGEFPDEDPMSPGKRVFFAGKIFKDKPGFLTFVNLFTIIFD
jgi:hypothetical protein